MSVALFLWMVGGLGLIIHYGVDDSITRGALPIFWVLFAVPSLFFLGLMFAAMKR